MMLLAFLFSAHADPSIDLDEDGVPDADDLCPWEDDTVDLDGNGDADCDETMFDDWGSMDASSALNWTVSNIYTNMTWSQEDAAGYTWSGSTVASDQGTAVPIMTSEQCLYVEHWRDFVVRANVEGHKNNTTWANVVFNVYGYSTPDCSGPVTQQQQMATFGFGTISSSWRNVGGIFNPDWNTRGIRISVANWSGTNTGAAIAVDNVLIRPVDPPPVFEPDPDPNGSAGPPSRN